MNSKVEAPTGKVIRVAGEVITVVGLANVRLNDVVYVGKLRLIGEVIRLVDKQATIQVYENTSGLHVGEPVWNTGRPLVVHLGPGLLGRVYDALQRPLENLAAIAGNFIERGVTDDPLSKDTQWAFSPCVGLGDIVAPGDVLGTVPETPVIEHRIMVPPRLYGKVIKVREGAFTIDEVIVTLETDNGERDITLVQQWPIRVPRPTRNQLEPHEPLITGTRIIDALFPIAKGGTAIIPGGFGTGKTVLEQSLARWANADIVIYVGCGERGNEMAGVLEEFPQLDDPHTGLSLMTRTVLIANTSNMPVAAREASIYVGITLAEYYRDMGYDTLLLADSTSRWGEALREISGRLEEIPGEEGYPAYLGSRLSEFYERSGRVTCLGNDENGQERLGSITTVGVVSPPGGDFSEPITQGSMRVAGAFWALDYNLSRRRHFPSISWTRSYTLYNFDRWSSEHLPDEWPILIDEAKMLLQRANELDEIVQLVGPEALSDSDRLLLRSAHMIRDAFLQQSSFDDIDRFCPLEKTYLMLKSVIYFYQYSHRALEAGIELKQLVNLPIIAKIDRMKEIPSEEAKIVIGELIKNLETTFSEMLGQGHLTLPTHSWEAKNE